MTLKRIAPDPAQAAALEAKRAALLETLARPVVPGEITPRYLARVKAGPVAVLNVRRREA